MDTKLHFNLTCTVSVATSKVDPATKEWSNGLEKVTKHHMSEALYQLFMKRYAMKHPQLDFVLWHNYYSSKAGCRVDGRFQSIGKMTQYLCKKADVSVFGLHQLRHLATAILKSYGKLSIAELQKFLRHSNQKTTEIYAGFLDDDTQVHGEILDDFWSKQLEGVAAE